MNDSVIFILGSGFSKSFCPDMPVMADFKAITIGSKYENLANFVNKYPALNKLSDIETLATVILSKSWFYDFKDKMQNLTLRYELLSLISDLIAVNQNIADAEKAIIQKFVSKLKGQKGVILSINYDLLIEKAIEQTKESLFYPCIESYESKEGSVIVDNLGETSLEYLKLHGSLDWFLLKGAESADISSVRKMGSDNDYYNIHKKDVPVFIPMAHNKESFLKGTLFSTLWSRAMWHLENAKEIHFVGYGFPETDVNNTVMFLEFKDKIKSIVVHKNEGDKTRLSEIFGVNIVKDVDAKEFIKDWTDNQ